MKLEVVKTFDNYFTANIILTKLQDAGIECYLLDEFTVTIDPILSNAIGGIKLVVKKEDESITNQLLKQFEADYMKSATCPTCGSNNFDYIAKQNAPNFFTAIFTWLFSSYAIAPDYVYHCSNCGYESERLPDNPQQELNHG
jgi:DNA-directed RNA polymerase subunit RPC12/RpoP